MDTPQPVSRVAGFLGKNTVWPVFWKQADILSLRVIPNISGQTFNRDGLPRQVRENAGEIRAAPVMAHGAAGKNMAGDLYE
ncbi:hypothetical protein [Achromobacter dolens]|uniref:hypothetical protein n=1 Tax=Achromobacter dolens TaxID=1287738 RepID=UPI0012DABE8D|nr:hypothetical protein [Achromobacter dolens]